MIDLIRNCVHHSDHSTYIERANDGNPSAIRKSAFTVAGAEDLRRENDGLGWYCAQQNMPKDIAIIEADIRAKYAKIRLAFHAGDTVKVPINPDQIISRLDALLSHHFEIFGPSDYAMTHGDYSICNHIFDEDRVKWVIDWEHFNNVLPASYDAVYAVLEPYLFWIANGHQPSAKSIIAVQGMLARICTTLGDKADIPSEPAMWLRTLVENNKDVWGAQWAKVPFIAFEESHVRALDKVLRNG